MAKSRLWLLPQFTGQPLSFKMFLPGTVTVVRVSVNCLSGFQLAVASANEAVIIEYVLYRGYSLQ